MAVKFKEDDGSGVMDTVNSSRAAKLSRILSFLVTGDLSEVFLGDVVKVEGVVSRVIVFCCCWRQ